MGNLKGYAIAAGEGGFWISDYDSDKVHKWDPKTNTFLPQGVLRGAAKAVGIHIIIADYKDNLNLKKWNGESWAPFASQKVSSLALDAQGTVYIVRGKTIYVQAGTQKVDDNCTPQDLNVKLEEKDRELQWTKTILQKQINKLK